MNIEPIIFFNLIAAILILLAVLAAIKRRYPLQDERTDTFKKSLALLDEARQKAVGMIDEANSKALDIINKTNLSADIASGNFNREIIRITSLQTKEFEKKTARFLGLYDQVLKDLLSKNIQVFQNISKDIEADTMREIKNFKDSLEKQTILSEDLVREKIDADYLAVKKSLDEYKTERLRKIDDEIYTILEKIAKKVIGKTLSLSEHEDLILKSLEKAKQEGVFEQ